MGWEFAEGDAFHPEANVAKMRSGHAAHRRGPLAVAERHRRLDQRARRRPGESAVVTCSALRRVYRDLLREDRPHVRFLPRRRRRADIIQDRMEHRPGHYMPPSLLPSQLATLEPLEPDEPGRRRHQRGHRRRRCSTVRCAPSAYRKDTAMMTLMTLPAAHRTLPAARRPPTSQQPYAGNGAAHRWPASLGILAVVAAHHRGASSTRSSSLMLGSAVLGAVATMPPGDIVDQLHRRVRRHRRVGRRPHRARRDDRQDARGLRRRRTGSSTTLVGRVGPGGLPWMMAAIAAILGLPLFFEVGVVLLVPVVILVARKTGLSLMKVGIPALAGLSVLHGLVPPHPGPLTAIGLLNADLGRTLLFGIIIAIPTVIVAGPLLARFVDQWVPKYADRHRRQARWRRAPSARAAAEAAARRGAVRRAGRSRAAADGCADLEELDSAIEPGAAGSASARPSWRSPCPCCSCSSTRSRSSPSPTRTTGVRKVVDVIGTPVVALLIAVIFCYFALGLGSGMTQSQVSDSLRREPARHRRHHPHRRGRRRLQADARRRRGRQRHQGLGHGRQHLGARCSAGSSPC